MIEIYNNITQNLNSGNIVAGIYLDIKKAFDSVDHDILLSKLDHYGIRGLPNLWFKNYLSNRKQFTFCNGHSSTLSNISSGVPQGSVLGPLLFLLYTNDMPFSINTKSHLNLFADDTSTFLAETNPEKLKTLITSTLVNINSWLIANKLVLNTEKNMLHHIYTKKNKKMPDSLNYIQLGTTKIHRVKSAKLLGVTIDEDLSFKDHVDNLHLSLLKTGNAFKMIRSKISYEHKFMFYYAYFYSKIQYGIEIYGNASASTLDKIQKQQNRCRKILFKKTFLLPLIYYTRILASS